MSYLVSHLNTIHNRYGEQKITATTTIQQLYNHKNTTKIVAEMEKQHKVSTSTTRMNRMIERTMNSRWRWTETKNQWINKPNGIEWMSQWMNKQENEKNKSQIRFKGYQWVLVWLVVCIKQHTPSQLTYTITTNCVSVDYNNNNITTKSNNITMSISELDWLWTQIPTENSIRKLALKWTWTNWSMSLCVWTKRKKKKE